MAAHAIGANTPKLSRITSAASSATMPPTTSTATPATKALMSGLRFNRYPPAVSPVRLQAELPPAPRPRSSSWSKGP